MFFFANYILLQCDIQPFAEYAVAPHVGAWIETYTANFHIGTLSVAPHVGAWIETSFESVCYSDNESHPMWVRGLKLLHLLQLLLLLIRRTPCGCVD